MSVRYAASSRAAAVQAGAGGVVGKMIAGALVVFGAAVVGMAAQAAPAWAHTGLVRASPADGAMVTRPPEQVRLEFDGSIQPEFVTVVVTAPDGRQAQQGDSQVQGRTVVQPLAVLAAGRYRVAYRVLSADGHPVARELSFVYVPPNGGALKAAPTDSAAGIEPSPAAARAGPDASGDYSGHVGHLVVSLIVIVGGGLILWWGGRQGDA
jgi:methionine-rich copper-binding protein CopC